MEDNYQKEAQELKKIAIQKEQSMIIEIRKREGVEKGQQPLILEKQRLSDTLEETKKILNNT